jgi:hypothetical protein
MILNDERFEDLHDLLNDRNYLIVKDLQDKSEEFKEYLTIYIEAIEILSLIESDRHFNKKVDTTEIEVLSHLIKITSKMVNEIEGLEEEVIIGFVKVYFEQSKLFFITRELRNIKNNNEGKK